MKRMFGIFERYLTSESADENWKPLVAKSKRYLNWYCFKIFQRKVYDLEDSEDEVEKKEFETFLNDFEAETRKRQEKEKSPELFGEEIASESPEEVSPDLRRKKPTELRKKMPKRSREDRTPESGRASESRSEKSPDSRDGRASESRNEKSPESCEIILSQDESEEDCQIIEASIQKSSMKPQNQKIKKQEIKKPQKKGNQKITDLIKKKPDHNVPKRRKLDCSLINIDESSSDDDCVILDSGSMFVK